MGVNRIPIPYISISQQCLLSLSPSPSVVVHPGFPAARPVPAAPSHMETTGWLVAVLRLPPPPLRLLPPFSQLSKLRLRRSLPRLQMLFLLIKYFRPCSSRCWLVSLPFVLVRHCMIKRTATTRQGGGA